MRPVLLLARRSIREFWRLPAVTIPNLFIPTFFLVVNAGTLGRELLGASFLHGQNFVAFYLPVSVLLAVATEASSSGTALVSDISSGYFDKLLVAPIPRTTVLAGRLLSDFVRIVFQASVVILVSLALGTRFKTGVAGVLVLVALSSLWGVAFAGLGQTIALRTRNVQATSASFLLFFPLLFMAPTFVPRSQLQGWLSAVAAVNPVTYIMEGLRSLVLTGWESQQLLYAALSIVGVSAVLTTLSLRALHDVGS